MWSLCIKKIDICSSEEDVCIIGLMSGIRIGAIFGVTVATIAGVDIGAIAATYIGTTYYQYKGGIAGV